MPSREYTYYMGYIYIKDLIDNEDIQQNMIEQIKKGMTLEQIARANRMIPKDLEDAMKDAEIGKQPKLLDFVLDIYQEQAIAFEHSLEEADKKIKASIMQKAMEELKQAAKPNFDNEVERAVQEHQEPSE